MAEAGDPFRAARLAMVELIAARGVRDPHVLDAMRAVRRERFVPSGLAGRAYEDGPLPIGWGQTISQPLMVAGMAAAAAVRPGDRVMEVGTGSGYAAAVLARLGAAVWTVERHAGLAEEAQARLAGLGCDARVRAGDGTLGWPEAAPFDAVVVSAGGPRVPNALTRQLAPGGRLVMPVGPHGRQRLVRRARTGADAWAEDDLGAVSFVPLIGEQGWAEDGG